VRVRFLRGLAESVRGQSVIVAKCDRGQDDRAASLLVEWPLVGNVVYAQFRDKAGNRSPIYASDGATYNPNAKKVYLPLVMK
jgi:hypothetical protein